jgi:nicotinamide-nucleotide amidase
MSEYTADDATEWPGGRPADLGTGLEVDGPSLRRSVASDLAEDLGGHLTSSGRSLAVAESLTGGLVLAELARVPGSGAWFRGGVVAYASEVKHDVLRVRPGPVVSRTAAVEMARGVARLAGSDIGAAITGVAGPDTQEGEPPGTVCMAACDGARVAVEHQDVRGTPEEVCARAATLLLRLVTRLVEAG